ncbi:MAG: ABC transporter permease [Streptosporangiaceae bacterium]
MARQGGGSLRTYLLTRIALVIPMVWILLTFVFVLMRVAPGDPVSAALGGRLSPEQLAQRRHAAGFDKPMIVQYGEYLRQVFTGHFGTSISDHRQVIGIVKTNGAATLELTLSALIVALIVGLIVGMAAGRFRDTWFDVGGRLFGVVVYAAPVFFTGLIAQLVFGKYLGWLPTSGQASPTTQAFMSTHTNILVIDAIIDGDWSGLVDVLAHLCLPAITLGLLVSGIFIRLVRVNVIQTLRHDYIEAARARGVREWRVVFRHAFRNALVPVITIVGLQSALLLSGAVLTEETFDWPGIGSALIDYLNNRDYVAVQGIITVFALAVVVVSLVIDFVNAWVDPRVRY